MEGTVAWTGDERPFSWCWDQMAGPGRKMKNHCRNAAVYAIIIFLSVYLPIYPSIYLPTYLPPIYIVPIYLSIYLSIYLYVFWGWGMFSIILSYPVMSQTVQTKLLLPSLFIIFSIQSNKQQYRINSQVLFCIQNFTQRFSSLSEPFHSCRMVFTCGSGLSEMQ